VTSDKEKKKCGGGERSPRLKKKIGCEGGCGKGGKTSFYAGNLKKPGKGLGAKKVWGERKKTAEKKADGINIF